MILILKYGDQINEGLYFKQTVFKNVIYYTNETNIILLTNNTVSAFPNSIVLNNLNIIPSTLLINKNSIKTEDQVIILNKIAKFNSSIKELDFKNDIFFNNISQLDKYTNLFGKKSLAFLFNPVLRLNFKSKLESAFVNQIDLAWNNILGKKYIIGINKIKGLGFGLTPSGDDFIAGLLFGININEVLYKKDLSFLIEEIYNYSDTSNIFSKNFLFLAKNGYFYEYLKNLILTINSNFSEKSLIENIKLINSMGNSSGSDLLTGLFLSIKHKIGI